MGFGLWGWFTGQPIWGWLNHPCGPWGWSNHPQGQTLKFFLWVLTLESGSIGHPTRAKTQIFFFHGVVADQGGGSATPLLLFFFQKKKFK
jgi:hypothetical protein